MTPLLVLDTNIVLDVFVFDDAAARPVLAALRDASRQWLATDLMRCELERVLAYPQIVPRLAFYRLQPSDVMGAFDRHARLVDVPPKAPVTCSDPDDQKFIDLAVAHQAQLLSKDHAVLSMRRRLQPWGVRAGATLDA